MKKIDIFSYSLNGLEVKLYHARVNYDWNYYIDVVRDNEIIFTSLYTDGRHEHNNRKMSKSELTRKFIKDSKEIVQLNFEKL